MPRKKKKNRSSPPRGTDEIIVSSPLPSSEDNNDSVSFLSLKIAKSSSSPLKTLKYEPIVRLNGSDADQLDVLSGDTVFLISSSSSTTSITEDSADFKPHIEAVAVALVCIAKDAAHSMTPRKNSPFSPTRSSSKPSHSKLLPGYCHVFPSSLAQTLLCAGNPTNEEPMAIFSSTPLAMQSTPPTKITGLTTPGSSSSTTLNSSSKSKFSFAKGGGGDFLLSTGTTSRIDANKSTSMTPKQGGERSKSSIKNLLVVPWESSLGRRLASILCRNATRLSIQCFATNGMNNEPRNSKAMKLFDSGSLGPRLVLAHTIGSFLSRETILPISFQGLISEFKVDTIEGKPIIVEESDDELANQMASLSLIGMKEGEGTRRLIDSFLSMDESLIQQHRIYKITENTIVTFSKDDSCSPLSDSQKSIEEIAKPKALVAGLDSTLELVESLLLPPLLHPEWFQRASTLRPPKGLLLHGPNGAGKSSLAIQIAQKLEWQHHIHLEHVHCTELQSQATLVGQAEKQLVKVFQSAKQPRLGKAGCLMIMDDIHLICPRRQGTNLGADRLSATILALLDGINNNNNNKRESTGTWNAASNKYYPMVILAITYDPSLLDPALRRPGRLDSEVEVPLPDDPATRSEILQFQLHSLGARMNLSSSQDLLSLARLAKGFTGADLKLAAKEAIRLGAVRRRAFESTGSELLFPVDREDIELALRSIKPSAIKSVSVEIPQVHWSSIGGMEEVKRQLREAIELPLTHGHIFQKLGIRPPRGVLLYGPPGCSKTLMARALATEGHMNFLAVKGPELLSKWLGESERALASLFRRARLASPSIIFFDEVDAIASKRGGGNSGGERLLSQLLTELDGIQSTNDLSTKERRVVVVCATNRPDLLDPALMRPGRLDRMIYVGVPDEESRSRIIQIALDGKACSDDIDISRLAQNDVSGGLSGAEIVAACRDASLIALEEDEQSKDVSLDGPQIRMGHMLHALRSMERQITPEMNKFYANFRRLDHLVEMDSCL